MVREIKFKYIFQDLDKNRETHSRIFTLNQIANSELRYIAMDLLKSGCSILKGDLQYTGLKDKNGKEIYEGDIIKTYHNKVAIVKWDGLEAAFNQFEKTEGWLCYNFDSCEIIGDIYNNPELLK